MKKLLKLVCSLGLCITLTACGSSNKVDDVAVESFVSALAKLSEVKSTEYDISLNAKMDDKDLKGKIYGALLNLDSTPQGSAVADIIANGQTLEKFIEIYYTQDAGYVNFMGQKIKSSRPAELTSKAADVLKNNEDPTVAKESIKEYLKSASIDGNKITIVPDIDKISQLEEAKTYFENISIEKLELSVELKDEFISSLTLNFSAKKMEPAMKLTSDLTLTMKNINQVTAIEFPDFSDYIEEPVE